MEPLFFTAELGKLNVLLEKQRINRMGIFFNENIAGQPKI